MKIYTNSFIHSREITPENFVEVFKEYADKLESVAKTYKSLIKFVQKKKIKIVEAHGFAHGGHFAVDEIDTARLKKEGIVVDFADYPELEENPTFYIDEHLDAVLEEEAKEEKSFTSKDFSEILDYEDEDLDEDLELTEEEQAALFKFIDEDEEYGIEQIDLVLDEIFPEGTTNFNLAEILKIPDDYDKGSLTPGNMIMDVSKSEDDDHFSFNLAIADHGQDPKKINYIREKSLFEYDCGECNVTHLEALDSAYVSLKTAIVLISNIVELSRDRREFSTALEFIGTDLRLLQWLLKLDYALDDFEEEEDVD